MAEKRQTYTAECTQEAVRRITEHRDGVAETARNLGSNVKMLRRWKHAYTTNAHTACPGPGRLTAEQEALRQRRAEGKRLRLARDMVKKALRVFVTAPRCNMLLWPRTSTRGQAPCSVRYGP